MNDRDKQLSLAIDDLTELRRLLSATYEIHRSSQLVILAKSALRHVEDAADMPKPSRIRTFVQRIKEAA